MSVSRTALRLIAACVASGALIGAAALPALADGGSNVGVQGRSHVRSVPATVGEGNDHGGDRNRDRNGGWYRDRGHHHGWYGDRHHGWYGDRHHGHGRLGDWLRDRGRHHGWYGERHHGHHHGHHHG